MRLRDWSNRAAAAAARGIVVLRSSTLTILGAPNYERYCEQARHAGHADSLLTRDEFWRRQLERRYGSPGARCC